MTWNISKSGPKADVLEAVRSQEAPANLAGGIEEVRQFERARHTAIEELTAGAGDVAEVEAFGYRNLDGSDQNSKVTVRVYKARE